MRERERHGSYGLPAITLPWTSSQLLLKVYKSKFGTKRKTYKYNHKSAPAHNCQASSGKLANTPGELSQSYSQVFPMTK